MTLLSLGILLWALTHWMPSGAPALRARLTDRLGPNHYKLGFTLSIILALVMIVLGWRSLQPTLIFLPPLWLRHLAMLLVLLGFFVMGAYNGRGYLNRWIRHPQLTGFSLWAAAHLLANGELRSWVLFSGLLIWSLGSMVLINCRDGPWEQPAYGGLVYDIRALVAGGVMFAVILVCHRWITGIALI